MSYATLDAKRIAKAAEAALTSLGNVPQTDRGETHSRKTILVERIAALARAAAESPNSGGITLTSEEFWLLSKNW